LTLTLILIWLICQETVESSVVELGSRYVSLRGQGG